jgi:hypothetical protein
MEFNKIEVSGRWYFQEIHHIGQKLNKMVSSLLLFDKKLKHQCTKMAQGPLSTEISNRSYDTSFYCLSNSVTGIPNKLFHCRI